MNGRTRVGLLGGRSTQRLLRLVRAEEGRESGRRAQARPNESRGSTQAREMSPENVRFRRGTFPEGAGQSGGRRGSSWLLACIRTYLPDTWALWTCNSQKTCSIGRVPNLKRIATILPRGQIA
jgi:hypothetical protein